jgi:hypothetical protein
MSQGGAGVCAWQEALHREGGLVRLPTRYAQALPFMLLPVLAWSGLCTLWGSTHGREGGNKGWCAAHSCNSPPGQLAGQHALQGVGSGGGRGSHTAPSPT